MKLRVITFNIRCCDDPGGHSIKERAPRIYDSTTIYDADVICFQEYRPRWEKHIEKYYGTEYEIFNKYRTTDILKKESAPILWKKEKFECVKTGYFWLSDTPEVESKGWDEKYDCHRMCEYVTLREKASGKVFTAMNAHFGFGDNGQMASARLICEYSKKVSHYPTFVTGDFNMKPNSPGYNEMARHFTDVNTVTAKYSGTTYHGYFRKKNILSHIDYCFVDKNVVPIKYEVIDKSFDGKFPSDHYGIYLVLEI